MHAALQVGTRAEITIQVTESMCPAFDGRIVHRVYSTWSLAHHMELAARRVLTPHLEPDEEGIGAHLSIDHLGPTPLGATVRVVAVATHVDGTTVDCRVDAYHVRPGHAERHVATGRQVQRVLPRAKLALLFRRATDTSPAAGDS